MGLHLRSDHDVYATEIPAYGDYWTGPEDDAVVIMFTLGAPLCPHQEKYPGEALRPRGEEGGDEVFEREGKVTKRNSDVGVADQRRSEAPQATADPSRVARYRYPTAV